MTIHVSSLVSVDLEIIINFGQRELHMLRKPTSKDEVKAAAELLSSPLTNLVARPSIGKVTFIICSTPNVHLF